MHLDRKALSDRQLFIALFVTTNLNMKQFLIIIAILSILGGIIVTILFLYRLSADYQFFDNNSVLLPETGQIGDFVGGVVGTIFMLAGFFILVLTLSEQTKFANKERFESKFFDLLKLHRENVRELEKDNVSGRKEFHKIFLQFLNCREDMKPAFKGTTEDKIYEKQYLTELKEKLSQTNGKIDLVDLAKLNFPYLVTFYGVGSDGKQAIYDILEGKYKKNFIEKAIEYIAMKPIEGSNYYSNWTNITKLQFKHRVPVTKLIRRLRNNESLEESDLATKATKYYYKSNYVKYYGGHQYQLGHYYRHLFQTFSFINIQKNIKPDEKYFYAKTLRAQLSTHEQLLLFINSLSMLGLVWDLTPEIKKGKWDFFFENKLKNKRLITKFNLIKNIPGKEIFGISYRDFYPDVEYEHMK